MISGLLVLPGTFLNLIYGPRANEMSIGNIIFYWLFMLGLPLFIVTLHSLIAHSIYKQKRWGRKLAIIYNSACLVAILFGMALARLTDITTPPLTIQAMIFLVFSFIVFGGIIFVFMMPGARQLMRN
jgi:hypothetical protein